MTNLNIGHRLQKLRITRSGSLKQKDVAEAIEISAIAIGNLLKSSLDFPPL